MALSTLTPSVKMYPNVDGHFVPVHIQWNRHTRAWHMRDNRGTLHLRRATVISDPKQGYLMLDKSWDYDPLHPEKIAFYRVPHVEDSWHINLSDAMAAFAHRHE